MSIVNQMRECGVIPVVVLDKSDDAVPCGKALLAGGISIMEITMRTSAAIDSIRCVNAELPDICLGAGTVVTLEQCRQAVDAGAKFIVSPGFNREVVEWCLKNEITVTPGCVTPTEITQAMELGLSIIKFFPANVYGGLVGMKALAAPFPGIKFVPTGGISEKNLAEYISAPFIHAVGGSWMCTQQEISQGNFDNIKALSSEAIKIIKSTRGV